MLGNAESVIIVPGYGMAVAKAQYAISEMVQALKAKASLADSASTLWQVVCPASATSSRRSWRPIRR